MMRIITGRARGTQLYTLEGETTRPTSERAKEAVFSAIQFELKGRRVLDLFAGSGQMALEALSRGALWAVLVDSSDKAVEIIKKNVMKTHFEASCTVLCADYADAVRRMRERVDLVILDPPYAKRLIAPALRLLVEADKLEKGAIIVCESGDHDIFDGDVMLADRFFVRKTAKYGVAHIAILEYKEASHE